VAAYRVQAAADLEKAQRDDAERRKSEAVAAFALRKAREAEAEAAARKAREEEARAEYRVMAEEFAKAGVAPGSVSLQPGSVQVHIHEVDEATEIEEDQAAGTA
jgi:geranylgeranyl pyrophosphate synthase